MDEKAKTAVLRGRLTAGCCGRTINSKGSGGKQPHCRSNWEITLGVDIVHYVRRS